MDKRKVAVYGLGNMGYLVAERVAHHFQVSVFDLDENAVAKAADEFGATAIREPAQVAEVAFVVLCLPTPAISLTVLNDIAPHLQRDTIIIETSTVNPYDMEQSARVLKPHGLAIIDASILAGVSQMAAGTASLLLGGSKESIETAQAVLDSIAEKQIYFGELGTGAAAKVINNAVAHAVMVVVAEAGSMATAAGVDIEKLIGLLSDKQMGLHRPLTYRYADRVVNGDYDGGMPLMAARKDSQLAVHLAQSQGVPLFAIQSCHTVYELGVAQGYGREDYAAIAKLWNDWGMPAVPSSS
ncbi:NAD(P)-dependent oxidoreductase [Vreelandella malpeensis]|uniref:NAD(P)-dependent oxidoreductase n=1 Tax=Vreelandella malpeensis TaxID=1172368 RepID=A0ABS8DT90_9GAMM|nr:NAD(P)-dependent oxidoreductase [Halomonas malpeensis]MCB8889512.1 NAD(P)-dependent oxidoreductase [Halomonas malpeensis]